MADGDVAGEPHRQQPDRVERPVDAPAGLPGHGRLAEKLAVGVGEPALDLQAAEPEADEADDRPAGGDGRRPQPGPGLVGVLGRRAQVPDAHRKQPGHQRPDPELQVHDHRRRHDAQWSPQQRVRPQPGDPRGGRDREPAAGHRGRGTEPRPQEHGDAAGGPERRPPEAAELRRGPERRSVRRLVASHPAIEFQAQPPQQQAACRHRHPRLGPPAPSAAPRFALGATAQEVEHHAPAAEQDAHEHLHVGHRPRRQASGPLEQDEGQRVAEDPFERAEGQQRPGEAHEQPGPRRRLPVRGRRRQGMGHDPHPHRAHRPQGREPELEEVCGRPVDPAPPGAKDREQVVELEAQRDQQEDRPAEDRELPAP